MARRMTMTVRQIGPRDFRKIARRPQDFDVSTLPLWSDGRKQQDLFTDAEACKQRREIAAMRRQF